MRKVVIVTVVLVGLAVGGTTAGSDGLKIESRLSQVQVIHRSSAIFVARLLKTDHEYDQVEAYGEKRRYVTKYRALVRVQRILMGRKLLQKQLGRSPWLWLEIGGLGRPGRWQVVKNHYPSSFGLGWASPGDEFIVYLPVAGAFEVYEDDHLAFVRHLDSKRYVTRVTKLVRLVDRLKDKVMRLPSRCLVKKTFWWQGRCRELAEVKKAISCPAPAVKRVTDPTAKLEISCRTKADVRHGMSYKWHKNGELAERALYGRGLRHGVVETFHDNGRRHCRSPFRQGRRYGRSVCWHRNGRLASTISYAQGEPAGHSLILHADGRVREGRCVWGKQVVWKTQSAWRARQWPCTPPSRGGKP